MFTIKFGKILANIFSNFLILYFLSFLDSSCSHIRMFDIVALFGSIWYGVSVHFFF